MKAARSAGLRPGQFRTLGDWPGRRIGFLSYKFYTGFIAVEIRPDRILLHYPWPRPAKTILRQDVTEVKLVKAKRKRFLGAGYMDIITRRGMFSTDRLHTFAEAVEIKETLEK